MNHLEITLNRPGDNKTHMSADVCCKWTPFSLQGGHFITTIFWIPEGSPLQVRLRVVKNLLSKIVFPITVRREEFANLFVTLKISTTLDKRENQILDDLLDYMEKNLGRFNDLSHINILHPLVDLYDTWTYYQVPLAAPCYMQLLGDHENWVERNISPNCNNSPEFEANANCKLENSF